MNPAPAAPRLSDEQLPEIIELINLTGDQEAKTVKALEFFAARLGAGTLPAGGPAEVADDQ
jgi:hypothetical protein